MKRIGNLYSKIYSIDNLVLAEKKAKRGKSKQRGVIEFNKNLQDNIINLHHVLLNNEYKVSKYYIFTLYDTKKRIIYKLPYTDRVVQHAIMNIMENIFVKTFTQDTYSCIKNRGIHKALDKLTISLKDKENKYCLKLDIKQFYPSINHKILKKLLIKKIKDRDLINLLFKIIDSADGIPIGNYLSQILANFYLTYFDHFIKEELKVKNYFRYCDDLVILGENKEDLRYILEELDKYLQINLKLSIKGNYQIFPIDKRGIDFLGYVSRNNYIRLRKSIKKRYIKMIKYNNNPKSIVSYNGWTIHANCINLTNKYKNYEKNRNKENRV